MRRHLMLALAAALPCLVPALLAAQGAGPVKEPFRPPIRFTDEDPAPMISITHYVDRDGQTLGAVAPRRYFCMQCHVPQTVAQPIVPNTFRDMDSLISRPSDGG